MSEGPPSMVAGSHILLHTSANQWWPNSCTCHTFPIATGSRMMLLVAQIWRELSELRCTHLGMWGANTLRAWWAGSLHFTVCWIAPGWMPDTHQSRSLTPFCNWIRERNYSKRFISWDKDWETSLIKYCHRQNRPNVRILIKFITKKREQNN